MGGATKAEGEQIVRARSVSTETFVLMQSQILKLHYGNSDSYAHAYYDALEILKISGVTHIGSTLIEDF